MDSSAAPWRVLDESEPSSARGAPDGPEAGPSRATSWRVVGGAILAAALALGAFAVAATAPDGSITVEGADPIESPGSEPSGPEPGSAGGPIVVDVQGAVVKPGVLRLEPGTRVGDAIAAAGGYSPRVDTARAGRELNLAASLKDGDRIVVPSRDDPPGTVGTGASGSDDQISGAGPVDLNSASAAELDELPGIGPKTAQKIIDARAEKPFASVEELRDRKVVGASVFERLRDLVTVR
jgi:competence protein ComEA